MTFGILEMLVGFAIPEWLLVRWTEDGVAIFVANNISSWFALYVRQDFEVRRRHRDSMDLTFSDMGHLSWLSPNTSTQIMVAVSLGLMFVALHC